jgi:hypothetical protein
MRRQTENLHKLFSLINSVKTTPNLIVKSRQPVLALEKKFAIFYEINLYKMLKCLGIFVYFFVVFAK